MQCVVKNSEYRMKLQQSGISEPLFESFVMDFMDKYGRFPNLDEIPRANSIQHLQDTLHITGGAANIEDILASTNTTNITDANIVLNDQYTDQDIKLFPLNNTALVYTDRRPSPYVQIQRESQQIAKNPNLRTVFTNMFDKFRNQYGINIHTITDKELEQWNDIPEVKTVSAFVHNSEIYINTDLADIDAPIHEMTHILLGSIRFKNPELYYQLVQTANQFEHFDERLAQYPNMAKEDAYEEIFVEEVGSISLPLLFVIVIVSLIVRGTVNVLSSFSKSSFFSLGSLILYNIRLIWLGGTSSLPYALARPFTLNPPLSPDPSCSTLFPNRCTSISSFSTAI